MFRNLCVFLIGISILMEGGQFAVEKAGLRLSVKVGMTSSNPFVIWVCQTLQQLAKAGSRAVQMAGGPQILFDTLVIIAASVPEVPHFYPGAHLTSQICRGFDRIAGLAFHWLPGLSKPSLMVHPLFLDPRRCWLWAPWGSWPMQAQLSWWDWGDLVTKSWKSPGLNACLNPS